MATSPTDVRPSELTKSSLAREARSLTGPSLPLFSLPLDGQEIKLHRTTSRASYWRIPRWESTPQNSGLSPEEGGPPQSPALAAMMSSNPFASWPDPALAMRLIEAYFERVNVLLPLLHKPSFYK